MGEPERGLPSAVVAAAQPRATKERGLSRPFCSDPPRKKLIPWWFGAAELLPSLCGASSRRFQLTDSRVERAKSVCLFGVDSVLVLELLLALALWL